MSVGFQTSSFSEVVTSGSGIWGSGFLEAVEKLQELIDVCCFILCVSHIAVLKLKSSSQLAYTFEKSWHNTNNYENLKSNFSQIFSDAYRSPVGCTPGNPWPASLTVGNTAIYHPSRSLGGILWLNCCFLSLKENERQNVSTDGRPVNELIIVSKLFSAVTLFQGSDPFLPTVIVGGENVEVVVIIKNLKEIKYIWNWETLHHIIFLHPKAQKISFQMNCEAYLKRVLVAAWYWDITAYNFHTPDSVQLDTAFHHRFFLKESHSHFICSCFVSNYSQSHKCCVIFPLKMNFKWNILFSYPRTVLRILQILCVQHKEPLFVVAWRSSFLLLWFFDHWAL